MQIYDSPARRRRPPPPRLGRGQWTPPVQIPDPQAALAAAFSNGPNPLELLWQALNGSAYQPSPGQPNTYDLVQGGTRDVRAFPSDMYNAWLTMGRAISGEAPTTPAEVATQMGKGIVENWSDPNRYAQEHPGNFLLDVLLAAQGGRWLAGKTKAAVTGMPEEVAVTAGRAPNVTTTYNYFPSETEGFVENLKRILGYERGGAVGKPGEPFRAEVPRLSYEAPKPRISETVDPAKLPPLKIKPGGPAESVGSELATTASLDPVEHIAQQLGIDRFATLKLLEDYYGVDAEALTRPNPMIRGADPQAIAAGIQEGFPPRAPEGDFTPEEAAMLPEFDEYGRVQQSAGYKQRKAGEEHRFGDTWQEPTYSPEQEDLINQALAERKQAEDLMRQGGGMDTGFSEENPATTAPFVPASRGEAGLSGEVKDRYFPIGADLPVKPPAPGAPGIEVPMASPDDALEALQLHTPITPSAKYPDWRGDVDLRNRALLEEARAVEEQRNPRTPTSVWAFRRFGEDPSVQIGRARPNFSVMPKGDAPVDELGNRVPQQFPDAIQEAITRLSKNPGGEYPPEGYPGGPQAWAHQRGLDEATLEDYARYEQGITSGTERASLPPDIIQRMGQLGLQTSTNPSRDVPAGEVKLRKVISGMQEGADMAGLDAAAAMDLETGGTAAAGFIQEVNGKKTPMPHIGKKYGLVEGQWTERPSRYGTGTYKEPYSHRTVANGQDADGTIWFGFPTSAGGRLTLGRAQNGKVIRPLIDPTTAAEIRTWLADNNIEVVNIAGNRESKNPGIYQRTYDMLIEAFTPEYELKYKGTRAAEMPEDAGTGADFAANLGRAIEKATPEVLKAPAPARATPLPAEGDAYWISSNSMTGSVTVKDGVITHAPPIMRKFIGQPLENLQRWMGKQGGFRVQKMERGAPAVSDAEQALQEASYLSEQAGGQFEEPPDSFFNEADQPEPINALPTSRRDLEAPLETTVVNIRTDPNAYKALNAGDPNYVFIGRKTSVKPAWRNNPNATGEWGNPFPVTKARTAEQAVGLYDKWLAQQIAADPNLLVRIAKLHGKNLVCYDAPGACHGDILKKLADDLWEQGFRPKEAAAPAPAPVTPQQTPAPAERSVLVTPLEGGTGGHTFQGYEMGVKVTPQEAAELNTLKQQAVDMKARLGPILEEVKQLNPLPDEIRAAAENLVKELGALNEAYVKAYKKVFHKYNPGTITNL